MTKKGFFLLLFVVALIFVSFNYSKELKERAFLIPHTIRGYYTNVINSIKRDIDTHFDQKSKIIALKKELKKIKRDALLTKAYKKKLNEVLLEQNLTIKKTTTKLIQATSYVKLSDYNKVWIEYADFNKSKAYGLIKGDLSAGIVIEKNSFPMALLQGDKKCTFSVVVGELKAPGIIFGEDQEMIIRFIPPWMTIRVGDKVTTSGLDTIFVEGIKVGIITKVIVKESFITAFVKPYYSSTKIPTFFHIIEK